MDNIGLDLPTFKRLAESIRNSVVFQPHRQFNHWHGRDIRRSLFRVHHARENLRAFGSRTVETDEEAKCVQLDSEKAHAAVEARAEAAEIHVQCMHECVRARVLCVHMPWTCSLCVQLELKWPISLPGHALYALLRSFLLAVASVTYDCFIRAIHGSAWPAELEAVQLRAEAFPHYIRMYTDATKKTALFRRGNWKKITYKMSITVLRILTMTMTIANNHKVWLINAQNI